MSLDQLIHTVQCDLEMMLCVVTNEYLSAHIVFSRVIFLCTLCEKAHKPSYSVHDFRAVLVFAMKYLEVFGQLADFVGREHPDATLLSKMRSFSKDGGIAKSGKAK